MTIKEAYAYILDRLNKHSTDSGQNISERAFVGAFNQVQYLWFSQRLNVDEQTAEVTEELAQFLVEECKVPKKGKNGQFLYLEKPKDYFRYKRMYGLECGECNLTVYAEDVAEGSVNTLLSDEFQKPSAAWQETFFTVVGNTLRFYVDDFTCKEIGLLYYRCPKEVSMSYKSLDGKKVIGEDLDPELTKSDLYEVLNLTALFLAGDINDQSRFQTLANFTQ